MASAREISRAFLLFGLEGRILPETSRDAAVSIRALEGWVLSGVRSPRRLFDAAGEILQSAHPMYVMPRVLLCFLIAAAPLFGQTNAPVGQRPLGSPYTFEGDTNTVAQLSFTNYVWNVASSNRFPAVSLLGTNFVVRPVSLSEAIQLALENNYAVQIARQDPRMARFNLAASYGVYDPALGIGARHATSSNPGGFDEVTGAPEANESSSDNINAGLGGYAPTGLTYDIGGNVIHSELSGRGEVYRGNAGITVTQPLLRGFWIDNARAAIMINKRDLKISEWAFREQLINAISQVELAYYDLILRRENIKVQRSALEWANQLLRENKKRVEVGAMAPLDEKQAESEVARYVAQLLQAEQNYTVQQNILKNLITEDFSAWTNVVFDPVETLVAVPASPELPESWRLGLNLRPELQQLKYALESQNINLRFLKNQIWPALDLTGSYGHDSLNNSYGSTIEDLRKNDFNSYSYGLRLSIPLGNISARNNYKAGVARKDQLLLQYKQLEQAIMVEIDNAIKLLYSQFQQVEATRQARLFAQDALAAEQKKYENGKSTSFLVLQFQRDLIQRRFEELSALAEYNKALSGLSTSEGATLQRFNLDLTLME